MRNVTRIYFFPTGAILAIPDGKPLLLPRAGLRLGLSYSRPWAADALRLLRQQRRLNKSISAPGA
jgi:hypothetical protein